MCKCQTPTGAKQGVPGGNDNDVEAQNAEVSRTAGLLLEEDT
jgi:hypothetical protein